MGGDASRAELPTGTVTFVFTDIEGSTRLAARLGDRFEDLINQHNAVLREALAEGVEIRTEGDAFFVVYGSLETAVSGVIAAQRSLASQQWPEEVSVKVRIGLHTAEATLGGDDYAGLEVHRASRISDTGHGGQIIVSESTASLIEREASGKPHLVELGEFILKDIDEPQRLFQLTAEGLDTSFPPPRATPSGPRNLPASLSTFIGRNRILADARASVAKSRLVTLTGPGGTGKTRLAIAVAQQVHSDFSDGATFVPLASLTSTNLVPSAILESLGQPVSGDDHVAALAGYLADRTLLLVLDNFEKILDAAPMVAQVLEAATGVHVLVTSRAPLRIRGEQELPVPPLEVPLTTVDLAVEEVLGFDSVALFVDRAQHARPDFQLDAENAAAVATLTAHLDGLPLAIELAASRVRMLPPEALVERLGSRLLTGGARDLPARQQTIRDTIAWSYDLLDESTRRFFNHFAVFAGGAALDEIEDVCRGPESVVFEALANLVDHSLVMRRELGSGVRFRMLETIREFATDQLAASGEEQEIRRRHAEAYLDLVEEAHPRLTKRERGEWIERLAEEYLNVHDALDWAVDHGEAEIAMRLVGSMWRFWHMRGHLADGQDHIEKVLALEGGSPEARTKALEAAGGISYWRGDLPITDRYYGQALDLQRQFGEEAGIANALYNYSTSVGMLRGAEAAKPLFDEAMDIYQELDDRPGIGRLMFGMGVRYFEAEEDAATASFYFQRSINCFDPDEDPFDLGWSYYMLSESQLMLGELGSARENMILGLGFFTAVNDLSAMVLFLASFAVLEVTVGNHERAFLLAGAMFRLKAETGTDLLDGQVIAAKLPTASQAAESGPESEAAFEAGGEMSLEEALEFALQGTA